MISPKTKPGHLTLHQKHRGTRTAGGLVWVEKQRLEAFPVDSGLPAGKFAIPDSRYCTGKGNDGGWVLSPSQVSGGVRAGSDLPCAHPPTPEGMWGCWSPPKFRGSCISSPVCASVLQNPSSPTRLLSPGLDCGDSSREAVGREKGSGKKLKACGVLAQGWLLGDRWESLVWDFGAAGVHCWEEPLLSLGRTCGGDFRETGSFYPIKPCLSLPRDGNCRTSHSGHL